MKQVLLRLKRLLALDSPTISTKQLELKTKALIKERLSDVDRWKNDKELLPNWNERSALLASYITANTHVIEFGAGSMYLKTILHDVKSYTPSDIVKRDENTIVCDLNKPIDFDLTAYDVAVFSGVLEYVYDIESVVKTLRDANINQIILSYCCSDIVTLTRVKNGWLSDYNRLELEAIFFNNGYEIKNYMEWQQQSLFNLIKKNKHS
ncbi:hypothetical protein [Corallibacter sp.]|uniref:hypothetical protein n=1 Tax=Corallibacter sp. TaxID=2038084 RepID=UPI003AB5CA63